MLMAGSLTVAAPSASAGCQNPGWSVHPTAEMCDGPVHPDGTWERCLKYYMAFVIGGRPMDLPQTNCYPFGPDQPPSPHGWVDPPTHIDTTQ